MEYVQPRHCCYKTSTRKAAEIQTYKRLDCPSINYKQAGREREADGRVVQLVSSSHDPSLLLSVSKHRPPDINIMPLWCQLINFFFLLFQTSLFKVVSNFHLLRVIVLAEGFNVDSLIFNIHSGYQSVCGRPWQKVSQYFVFLFPSKLFYPP